MSLKLNVREKWAIAAIYAIPLMVLVAALAIAFRHAEEVHQRNSPHSAWWEGWAFAVMVELPALMGLLLLSVFPKIAPGRKPTVPRLLFVSAAVISLLVQQVYAGSNASLSERVVAGFPSVIAGIFVEVLFWVIGLIDEARNGTKADATPAPSLVSVPAPPRLIPEAPTGPVPLPSPQPLSPEQRLSTDIGVDMDASIVGDMGPAGVAVSPGTSADTVMTVDALSPRTRPPLPHPVDRDTVPDSAPVVRPGHVDIPQVTGSVPPSALPEAGGDTEDEVLPEHQPAGEVSPIPGEVNVPLDNRQAQGDSDPRDTQDSDEGDTDPNGEDNPPSDPGDSRLTPEDIETWTRSLRGDTKKALAAHFNCSEKTIQRRLAKVREAQKAGHPIPELTGAAASN